MMDLVNGISAKLYEIFGANYRIYLEKVEQDLTTPCFYIMPITNIQSPLLNTRYQENYSFDIHFFPSTQGSKSEMFTVAEQMKDLEWIKINGDGKLIRGTRINYNIIDNVLHFFISYNLQTIKIITPDDDMEILKVESEVKSD